MGESRDFQCGQVNFELNEWCISVTPDIDNLRLSLNFQTIFLLRTVCVGLKTQPMT